MLHAVPMQGSVFRRGPYQLSVGLLTSVSRRISWSQLARCSDGASQSINPTSPVQSTTQEKDSVSKPFSNFAPLPSQDAGFLSGRSNDGSLNDGKYRSRFEPSRPIPGRYSKYSRPISRLHTASAQSKTLRRDRKAFRKPMGDIGRQPDPNVTSDESLSSSASASETLAWRKSPIPNVPVDKLPEWMENGYQFSYSENPSAPILGFRQAPWSPFGPEEMVSRPWTGRAPLKPSKKKLPVFDSFNPPPAGKKGVKYVQKPGPFPPGEGPKEAKTREEILGAPLTPQEISRLVEDVNKRPKQLNLGRDGLTHNMLDNVHTHWKRSVCCKIKCKGVPTVDLDNVARVIEERTGGVIIHRAGGVMYVFRGRNYNYKDRPKIPIMLWKPPTPIYPKLIQAVPEGLTEEEAKRLRSKGRRAVPLCRLSKNGVYMTLVADVRAQLEIDEVVRVDCTGLNPSDYKKIGAKLKDLVPCILLSFEKEQIIMCRARPARVERAGDEDSTVAEPTAVTDGTTDDSNMFGMVGEGTVLLVEEAAETDFEHQEDLVLADTNLVIDSSATSLVQGAAENDNSHQENLESAVSSSPVIDGMTEQVEGAGKNENNWVLPDSIPVTDETGKVPAVVIDEVDELWQKAIDDGKALQLDNQTVDLDDVFEKAAELSEVLEASNSQRESETVEEERTTQPKASEQVPTTSPFDVPPIGGLGVDELAKLLVP